jgi:hypothetical protein
MFNKEVDYLENRLDKIKRYKTFHEKEALLLDDESTIMDYYNTLQPDGIKPLNEFEALAFIIKAREISVSDILEGMYECKKCKTVNDIKVELNTLINTDLYSEEYPDFPIGLFETMDDIMDEEVSDEISVLEFNEIEKIMLENNLKILDLSHHFTCRIQSCGHVNEIKINPLQILSKLSLTGLYGEIFNMFYYGNTSVADIENMYPFERALYAGMLKDKVEKEPPKNQLPFSIS